MAPKKVQLKSKASRAHLAAGLLGGPISVSVHVPGNGRRPRPSSRITADLLPAPTSSNWLLCQPARFGLASGLCGPCRTAPELHPESAFGGPAHPTSIFSHPPRPSPLLRPFVCASLACDLGRIIQKNSIGAHNRMTSPFKKTGQLDSKEKRDDGKVQSGGRRKEVRGELKWRAPRK